MCIAIIKRKGITMDKTALENSWNNNEDGAGVLWAKEGKLHSIKIMEDFDVFYYKYKEIERANPDSHIVIHFRTATHGTLTEKNTHPFFINENLAFVHNGIFSGLNHKEKSDTYLFRDILKEFPEGFLENKSLLNIIEMACGTGNKLVFLDNTGKYTIIGKGHWERGVWYSNYGYSYKAQVSLAELYYARYGREYEDVTEGIYNWERYKDPYYYGEYDYHDDDARSEIASYVQKNGIAEAHDRIVKTVKPSIYQSTIKALKGGR